jgi:hypothetical protein
MKFLSTFRVSAIGVLLVAGALDSAAQYNHPKEPIGPTLSYQMVKTGLYMISGKGGNCLLRLKREWADSCRRESSRQRPSSAEGRA